MYTLGDTIRWYDETVKLEHGHGDSAATLTATDGKGNTVTVHLDHAALVGLMAQCGQAVPRT